VSTVTVEQSLLNCLPKSNNIDERNKFVCNNLLKIKLRDDKFFQTMANEVVMVQLDKEKPAKK